MKYGKHMTVGVILFIIAAIALSGIYRVDEGEQALILTFGEISGRN